MTRVLFVSHTLDFMAGGAERVLLEVLTRIDRERFDASIFVGRDSGGVPTEFSALGLPIAVGARLPMEVTLGARGILATTTALLALAFGLVTRLRRERIEVVHVNSIFALHFALWPCRLLGVPLVYHEHGLPRDREGSVWSRFYPFLIERVDHTLAITEAVREQVLSYGIPPERVTTVHNGIDPDATGAERSEQGTLSGTESAPDGPAEDGSVGSAFTIVQIANFLDWKGQHVAVRALALLRRDVPAARLVFYGQSKDLAYEAQVRALVEELELTEQVEFGGFRTDLAEQLPDFDCLVVASRAEPFGLVLLEAMRAGVPIVATAAGGVPEIVEDGVNGLLFPPDDSEALAVALSRIARDPATADRFRSAGRAIVRERFSFDAQVDGIQRALEAQARAR